MHQSPSSVAASRVVAMLVLLCAIAAPAHAVTVVVGNGAGCTHATIQAAIDAAESALEPSVVRITRSATYTQQALTVNTSQPFEITGGYATCAQANNDGTKTTIDGAGGAAASVLRIVTGTGGNVLLRHLRIQGGDPSGANPGGGIFFGGNGRGELRDAFVLNNIAGNGGGIYAGGAVPGAQFVIGANVRIVGNTARFSGGGVFVDGLTLTMLEPNSTIALNSAFGTSDTGLGGGLLIRNLQDRVALARIASEGDAEFGAVEANEARVGGGIAVIGEDYLAPEQSNTSRLSLFRRDGQDLVAVRNNFASVAGGGLFAEARTGDGRRSQAIVDAWQARIDGNLAPSGAAIYVADTEFLGTKAAGEIHINTQRPADAQNCPFGSPCGSISGNVAQTGGGQLTDGAVIQLQRGAIAEIGSALGGVELRGNAGGRLVDVQPEFTDADPDALVVVNALAVENQLSQHLVRAQQATVSILDTTIAGNTIGTGDVLAMNANLELRRSILWQPGMTSLSQSGGTRTVSGVIASEVTSLGGEPLAIAADPRFFDPSRGDYRVQAASPAVDFEVAAGGSDITGAPRDRDLEVKPNARGPRDVGAFERFAIGVLVRNFVFQGNLRLWDVVASGFATLDPTQDFASIGSIPGSAKLSGPPNAGSRLLGLKQCVHLPGPGRYLLNGAGQTEFGPTVQRDSVILGWELRSTDTEQCSGGNTIATGEHFLTRQSTWATPEQPAVISLSAGAWTPSSTLVVSLIVIDNGQAIPPVATGWFDYITLLVEPFGDTLFANGFE